MIHAAHRSTASRRLLVVDDEQALVCVLRRYLARSGWALTDAQSAADALAQLDTEQARFDAVVVDLHLPDLGGAALCQRILARHPELAGRLLVTTGDVNGAAEQLERARLTCPVIAKPFDLPDLDRALDELLGDQARRRPA